MALLSLGAHLVAEAMQGLSSPNCGKCVLWWQRTELLRPCAAWLPQKWDTLGGNDRTVETCVCVCHSQQTSLGTMMFCTVSKCFSLSKPFKNPSPRTVHAGLVLRAPYNRIVSLLHGDRPWPCAVETAST